MSEKLNGVSKQLIASYINSCPVDALAYFEKFSLKQKHEVLGALDKAVVTKFFSVQNPVDTVEILKHYPDDYLDVLNLLDLDAVARIIKLLDGSSKEKFLGALSRKKEIKRMLHYPSNVAGALMESHVVSLRAESTVADAMKAIKQCKLKNMMNIYVVDLEGVLTGILPIKDLVIADDHEPLGSLANADMHVVHEMTQKNEVIQMAEKYKFASVPVVDKKNCLVGVIRYERLVEIIQKGAVTDLQKMVGVSEDETPLSTPFFSMKKRLPWLTINLVTTFLAAFVVGIFEPTIQKVTALAVLLPIVAGQSGNTGAQAQAVTIRGLALREIHLHHKWKVLFKEAVVGFFNGLSISILCAVSVYIWSGSLALSGVIGVSMIISMMAAGVFGAGVPIALSAMGQDPAVSSSIILTTFTDVFGFLSFLGLAAIFSTFLLT
jgi:magnesium transporter